MKQGKQLSAVLGFLTCVLFFSLPAWAVLPSTINYQAYLTNDQGIPINDSLTITFRFYTSASGGSSTGWEETQVVPIEKGLLHVELGALTPLILSDFDVPIYLGITINGETEMLPRREITLTSYAIKAGDSSTLESFSASDLNQSSHLILFNNPHTVTHEQTGAAALLHLHAGEDIGSGIVAESNIDALLARDNEIFPNVLANDGSGSMLDADMLDGFHANHFSTTGHVHDVDYYSKAEVDVFINNLKSQIDQLTALLSHFSRSGNEVYITGANLHIRSGTGATDGKVNGQGNLIIGYNEEASGGSDRTGSHNLVVGHSHSFSRYGGIVAGLANNISGISATVIGGVRNVASGDYSSVTGGRQNSATSSHAAISGGIDNIASGNYSSVSGGSNNSATASSSSVSGGIYNNAIRSWSSISGGGNNTSDGLAASIAGGRFNITSGEYSSIGGGGGAVDPAGNKAVADYSSILGGTSNITGDTEQIDHSVGTSSTISGGYRNNTSGGQASVSGGSYNIAAGLSSHVSGGGGESSAYGNLAFAHYSSISGGAANTAGDIEKLNHSIGKYSSIMAGRNSNTSGNYSSISGGGYNTASGYAASVSAGQYNIASGEYSSVTGGGNGFAINGNEAYSRHSTVVGGIVNVTGDKSSGDSNIGQASSILGGAANRSPGYGATVSGGYSNEASGQHSSVSGGFNDSVDRIYNWRAGSLFEEN